MADDCEHREFAAEVGVHRLTDTEDGPVTGYSADVTIWCVDCKEPFRFLGVEHGLHPTEPRSSVDGRELRAPIIPATSQLLPPLAYPSVGVRRIDG